MIIGFWSPLKGKGHPAETAVCAGLLHGIESEGRILVAGRDGKHLDVDRLLESGSFTKGGDMGMEAIARLAKNNRLPSETVPQYTVGVLKEERLDYLPVVREEAGQYGDWYGKAYRTAAKHYDQVYLLIEGGVESEEAGKLLAIVDHLFICVEQEVHVLEHLKSSEADLDRLCAADKTVLLSPCHRESKWTPAYVKRKYGWKKVRPIPFNTQYMDAVNQGTSADFVFRQSACRTNDANHPWVEAYRSLNKFIVNENLRLLKRKAKAI